ncbi:MAG: hypothetical protein C6Y22_09330, partial [Hapalosiphonaceae cyanobacterium JJU2]
VEMMCQESPCVHAGEYVKPPEQMNGKAVPQSDFFALGRTFVYLLTGKFPHEFSEHPRTGELIWRDSAKGISKNLADFIDYLMAPFPGNRPKDTQEILQRVAEIDRSLGSSGQFTQKTKSSNTSQTTVGTAYAEFWKRLVAYIIDVVILTITTALVWKVFLSSTNILPSYVINTSGAFGFALLCTAFASIGGVLGLIYFIFIISSSGTTDSSAISGLVIAISGFIAKWLYWTKLESSDKQATFGKIALGMIVTDINGNRLTFTQANMRFWSKTVSSLTLLVGFIMAGFGQKKQALHDRMADTLVLNKRLPIQKVSNF